MSAAAEVSNESGAAGETSRPSIVRRKRASGPVTDAEKRNGGGSDAALITLIVVAGAVLVVLIGFVRRVATRYTITTRRLNIKHGIISRDVQETKIERVQDVNYRQSVFQRIMQIGDVDFDTAAENSASDFIFAGVADPEEVVDRVHHATEPAGPPPRTREEAERRWDSGL